MITAAAVLIVWGGILVVSALFGSGFETQWVKLPPLSRGIRLVSGILGVILVVIGIGLSLPTSIFPTPSSIDNSNAGSTPITPPPPSASIDVKGTVVDIFGNPKKEVWVTTEDRYSVTNEKGEYYFSNISIKKVISIVAHYSWGDTMKYNSRIDWTFNPDTTGKTGIATVTDTLVIEPVTIRAFFCKNVNRSTNTPEGKFQDDLPIPLNSLSPTDDNKIRKIWCLLTITGPLDYHKRNETIVSFEWYYDDKLQDDTYKASIGVSPTGWKHPVSKIVWIGKWHLKIRTKHKEIENIPFEIY